jgi:hypothetical protein
VLREKSTETLACPLQVFPEDFSVCEFVCSRSWRDESNSASVRPVVRLLQEGSRQSGVEVLQGRRSELDAPVAEWSAPACGTCGAVCSVCKCLS